jgi:hypothetical protein
VECGPPAEPRARPSNKHGYSASYRTLTAGYVTKGEGEMPVWIWGLVTAYLSLLFVVGVWAVVARGLDRRRRQRRYELRGADQQPARAHT